PARVRVLARRHADDAFEVPLEVIRTAADPARERGERHGAAFHVREIPAGPADFFDPGIVHKKTMARDADGAPSGSCASNCRMRGCESPSSGAAASAGISAAASRRPAWT